MEKWTAIFVPLCTMKPDCNTVFLLVVSQQSSASISYQSSSFSGKRSGQPPTSQPFISLSGLRPHPSVQIITINLCAFNNKNSWRLCLCEKEPKDVSTAMLITSLYIVQQETNANARSDNWPSCLENRARPTVRNVHQKTLVTGILHWDLRTSTSSASVAALFELASPQSRPSG